MHGLVSRSLRVPPTSGPAGLCPPLAMCRMYVSRLLVHTYSAGMATQPELVATPDRSVLIWGVCIRMGRPSQPAASMTHPLLTPVRTDACDTCDGCDGCDGCDTCDGCDGCDGCDRCDVCDACHGCDRCDACDACDGCPHKTCCTPPSSTTTCRGFVTGEGKRLFWLFTRRGCFCPQNGDYRQGSGVIQLHTPAEWCPQVLQHPICMVAFRAPPPTPTKGQGSTPTPCAFDLKVKLCRSQLSDRVRAQRPGGKNFEALAGMTGQKRFGWSVGRLIGRHTGLAGPHGIRRGFGAAQLSISMPTLNRKPLPCPPPTARPPQLDPNRKPLQAKSSSIAFSSRTISLNVGRSSGSISQHFSISPIMAGGQRLGSHAGHVPVHTRPVRFSSKFSSGPLNGSSFPNGMVLQQWTEDGERRREVSVGGTEPATPRA